MPSGNLLGPGHLRQQSPPAPGHQYPGDGTVPTDDEQRELFTALLDGASLAPAGPLLSS